MLYKKLSFTKSKSGFGKTSPLSESALQSPIEQIRVVISNLNIFADLGIRHGEKCGLKLGPKSLKLLSERSGVDIPTIKSLIVDVFHEIEEARKLTLSKLFHDSPKITVREIARAVDVEPDVIIYYLKKYDLSVAPCSTKSVSGIEIPDSDRSAIKCAIASIGKKKLKFAGRKPSFWTLNALSKATGICADDLKKYSDSGAMDFFEIASKT